MNRIGERTLAFACRHRPHAVVTCFLSLDELVELATDDEVGVVLDALDRVWDGELGLPLITGSEEEMVSLETRCSLHISVRSAGLTAMR